MQEKQIEMIRQKLAETHKKGAVYADVFIQAGTAHSAHYEDGRIEELSSSNTDGSGARIIAGDKTFFSIHQALPYPAYHRSFLKLRPLHSVHRPLMPKRAGNPS